MNQSIHELIVGCVMVKVDYCTAHIHMYSQLLSSVVVCWVSGQHFTPQTFTLFYALSQFILVHIYNSSVSYYSNSHSNVTASFACHTHYHTILADGLLNELFSLFHSHFRK